jgi:hypothetical protein
LCGVRRMSIVVSARDVEIVKIPSQGVEGGRTWRCEALPGCGAAGPLTSVITPSRVVFRLRAVCVASFGVSRPLAWIVCLAPVRLRVIIGRVCIRPNVCFVNWDPQPRFFAGSIVVARGFDRSGTINGVSPTSGRPRILCPRKTVGSVSLH